MPARKLPATRLAFPGLGLALALGLVLGTAAPGGGGSVPPGPQGPTPTATPPAHERPMVVPGPALEMALLRRALMEKVSVKIGLMAKPDIAGTVLALDEVSVLVQGAGSLQLVMLNAITTIDLPAAFSDLSGLSAGLASRTMAPAPARTAR